MRSRLVAIVGVAALLLVLLARSGDEGPSTSVLPSESLGADSSPPTRSETDVAREPLDAVEPAGSAEPPAPRDDAGAYREPGGDDWTSFTELAPPQTVAGRVLRGVTPVAGARVRLWAAASDSGREPLAAREAATDENGTFRFDAVAAGDYHVRADEGGERTQTRTEISAERGQGVLLLFGRSVVEGVVHDERGGTLAGITITVAGIGPLPSRFVYTSTDASGRFRVGALVAGRYHVQAARGSAFDPADQRMVSLEVADRAELVFGRTAASVRWTTRFVDARGDPISGERPLTFRHAERRDERRAWTDEDGAFELEIEPGRWIAYLGDGLHPDARVGEAVLERAQESTALVHEPARLIVPLRANEPELAQEALLERARPLLLLRAVEGAARAREAEVLGGALHWLAVGAGRHELLVLPPLRLLDRDASVVALTIVAGEATRELELEVALQR